MFWGVVNWVIDGEPQKKNYPSFYLKHLGWFIIMDKFTGYSKARSYQIYSQWQIVTIRLVGIFMQVHVLIKC